MIAQGISVRDRRAVERDYDVALTHSGARRGAVRRNRINDNSAPIGESQICRRLGCYRLRRHAQTAAPNFSCRQELLQNIARHIGRNREADADIAAGI